MNRYRLIKSMAAEAGGDPGDAGGARDDNVIIDDDKVIANASGDVAIVFGVSQSCREIVSFVLFCAVFCGQCHVAKWGYNFYIVRR